MDSHVREGESLTSGRRQVLCLVATLVAVPRGVIALAIPPQERIAKALKEIEAALAEIYPGAHQRSVLEMPNLEAFASPLLPDGTFMSGRAAMASVTADSFHERYGAGRVCREDPIRPPGRILT